MSIETSVSVWKVFDNNINSLNLSELFTVEKIYNLLDLQDNHITFTNYIKQIVQFHMKENNNKTTNIFFEIKEINSERLVFNNNQNDIMHIVINLEDTDNYYSYFTNINHNEYKYKDFNDKSEILVSIPRKNEHFVIKSNNIYGFKMKNENINISFLTLNIYVCYDNTECQLLFNSNFDFGNTNIDKIEVKDIDSNIVAKPSFYNSLLYDNENILNLLENDLNSKNQHTFKIFNKEYNNFLINKKSLLYDLNTLHINNRFDNYYYEKNFFCENICKWISSKSNNNNDSLNQNNDIFSFIKHILSNKIIPQFSDYFCLPDKSSVNILNISIINNDNIITQSNGFLNILINLNHTNDYISISFSDNINFNIYQGDVMCFSKYKQIVEVNTSNNKPFIFLLFTLNVSC